MQKEMLERARAHRDSHTYVAHNMEEFEQIFNEKSGFVKAMWCGCRECEDQIKEKLAVTSAACLLNRNRSQIPAYVVENCEKDGILGKSILRYI